MKELINRSIEFNIKDQPESIKGILLDYSEEWSLLHNNPVDYVIDGQLIIKNNQILNYKVDSLTVLKSKILLKKQKMLSNQFKINIENSKTIFQYLFKEKIIFSITINKTNRFLIGRIKSIAGKKLFFEIITTKAKWSDVNEINIDEINIMEFNSDYINSLLLIIK